MIIVVVTSIIIIWFGCSTPSCSQLLQLVTVADLRHPETPNFPFFLLYVGNVAHWVERVGPLAPQRV